MTILGSLLRAREARSVENPSYPLTSTALMSALGGEETAAGTTVTVNGALGLSTFWRCCALVSGTVASLDRGWFDEAGQRVRVRPDPLQDPHPLWTASELWALVMTHLLVWGNAYLLKTLNGRGQVERLLPLDPRIVEPRWVLGERSIPREKVYKVSPHRGQPFALPEDVVLHVPGPGYDGLRGLSPLQVFRQSIGAAMASERYAARFFGSGSLMSGLLTTKATLRLEEAKSLKEQWRAQVAGLEHSHEVVVLGGETSFQPLSIPPEDAQLLQTRSFHVKDLARIFGVPLVLLGAEEGQQPDLEAVMASFVNFTIRPWTTRLEDRLNREVAPAGLRARFITEPLVRANTRDRYAAWLIARRAGILTVNEVRTMEGFPPLEDPRADDPFVPIDGEGGARVPGTNEGSIGPVGDGSGNSTPGDITEPNEE